MNKFHHYQPINIKYVFSDVSNAHYYTENINPIPDGIYLSHLECIDFM